MSDIVDEAVRRLSERLAGESLNGSVRFVIADEGSVRIDDAGVRADDSPADCTMSASADTFQGILDGDVSPTAAFMTGRLKVDGDMGLAMRLGSILG